jgi:branched-chain amino acid transport system substrate-binding protein
MDPREGGDDHRLKVNCSASADLVHSTEDTVMRGERQMERLWRIVTLAAMLALVVGSVASCATPVAPTPEVIKETVVVQQTVVVEVTPEPKEPIIIGTAAPFTGPIAYIGQDIIRALTLAAEELNAEGGIAGHPVQVVACDEDAAVEQAVACARRLVEQDKVTLIIGMGFSGAVLASQPILEGYEVIDLESTASAKVLTDSSGTAGGNIWFFRAGPHDGMMAMGLADYIAADVATISFLIANTEQGRGIVEQMQPLLDERGVEVLSVDYFETGQPDYRPVITKIKALNPEALFTNHEAGDGNIFIRQYRELGMTAPIFERGSMVSEEFLENTADDLSLGEGIISAAQTSTLMDPGFEQRYLTRWGEMPHMHGVGLYASLKWIIPVAVEAAIEETGEITSSSIRDALQQISVDVPMLGHVEFDEYNQAHPSVKIHQIQNGQIVLLAEVPTE